jgi:hypothetical protein
VYFINAETREYLHDMGGAEFIGEYAEEPMDTPQAILKEAKGE